MAVVIDLYKLEQRADALGNTLATKAHALARNTTYTAEGKQERWEQVKKTHTDEALELRGELNIARRGAEQIVDYARAAVVGEVPDPEKPDAGTELAVARILARHESWDVDTVKNALAPILGTETAALVMEELVHRGAVDEQVMDAIIEQMNPHITTLRKIRRMVLQMIGELTRLIEELDTLLERGPLAPASPRGGVHRVYRATLEQAFGNGYFRVFDNGKIDYDTDNLGAN